MRPDRGQEGSSGGASVVRPTCSEPHHCSSTSSILTCGGTEAEDQGGAEITTAAPFSYLKQLVRFKLLGAEDDAVRVAPHPAGLAAIAQQHHVFAVFAVEPMGDARNYKQKKAEFLTTMKSGASNATLRKTAHLATGLENSSR